MHKQYNARLFVFDLHLFVCFIIIFLMFSTTHGE